VTARTLTLLPLVDAEDKRLVPRKCPAPARLRRPRIARPRLHTRGKPVLPCQREKVRLARASPLEGAGFEPSVPPQRTGFFEIAREPGDDKNRPMAETGFLTIGEGRFTVGPPGLPEGANAGPCQAGRYSRLADRCAAMAPCGPRYARHRDNQAPQFRHRARHTRHPGFASSVGRVARGMNFQAGRRCKEEKAASSGCPDAEF
jgi:hypothetical protein